ncbi:MAG: RNA 2',3'-cyclic phosphodiesterase [Candidatus Omnitrophica bacterium]|nr:RNA 2',3'-cyclic phosphodiesterase [Candidatus Omnitrophota bacterium]
MNNQRIRAFIAIKFNKQIKSLILKAQDKLKEYHANIKWVNLENTHITLQFLGNIDQSQIEIISKTITNISKNHHPFLIKTTRIEMFPAQSPKIISLGINKKENNLKNLADDISISLAKVGFLREREFSAHITLGRIKNLKKMDQLKKDIQDFDFNKEIKKNINSLTLFKTTLSQTGPIYQEISSFTLKY